MVSDEALVLFALHAVHRPVLVHVVSCAGCYIPGVFDQGSLQQLLCPRGVARPVVCSAGGYGHV